MAEKKRFANIVDNLYAALIFAGVCMIASVLYTHYAAAWEKPVVNALITGFAVMAIFFVMKAIRSLPEIREKITVDNAGSFILEWLIKFNLEVKKLNDDESHFMYKVTTDGGKVITVRRSRKNFPDYISIRALVSKPDDIKKYLDALSEQQKAILRIRLSLALSNGVMGYKTDSWLSEDLWVFKHVPISATLREETIINAIWEVEAMVSTVYNTAALYLIENNVVDVSRLIEASGSK